MKGPQALIFGLGLGAIKLGTEIARRFRKFDFKHKVVLITGGSRGLGLVLARQFAAEKAKLALVARDRDELIAAKNELAKLGVDVEMFVCDVRDEEKVKETVQSVKNRFGTIDVLINNAGVIQVGPLETMTSADFRDAMDTHFFGPLYFALAVIPDMRSKQSGRIVNISSIGGKVAAPHLVPYDASKFALVGLSEGLRHELMKDNVFVSTICPGLMRTGSHVNAKFKGQNASEYAWFSISNALPFISTSAESAAKQIVTACRYGDAELIITHPAMLAARFQSMMPEAMSDALALTNRLLPQPGGIGTESRSGRESQGKYSPNVLTRMSNDPAVQKNNEGFAAT